MLMMTLLEYKSDLKDDKKDPLPEILAKK